MQVNSQIRQLDLSRNYFSELGAIYLARGMGQFQSVFYFFVCFVFSFPCTFLFVVVLVGCFVVFCCLLFIVA